jgi:NhaP-type Na+/H+ or K+/H+ antiporter
MNSAGWFVLVGALMLAMGLTVPLMKRFAVTSAMLYLSVGLLVGPTGFGLFHFNPLEQSALLEVLTEVVVLISLFSAGVKMPVPVTLARWRSPVLLAFVSMTVTVALVAGFGYYALGLSLGAAVLLGAILAPTDPVLATDVQIRHAEDRDRLRFTLTCEAGMNDGSAFPFVMLGLGLLGLHDLGIFGQRWWLVDVLWATGAAIFLFTVARPLSVMLGLAGSRTPWRIRGLTSWFGVRGIGSLFYLMYALEHGISEELAIELIHLTLVVVALSILMHGVSVKPMMRKFWRRSRE